jgi:hypothetical protein
MLNASDNDEIICKNITFFFTFEGRKGKLVSWQAGKLVSW